MRKLHNIYQWLDATPDAIEEYATNITKAFFTNYDLAVAHDTLWLMMKIIFIDDKNDLYRHDRENIIVLYEHLHELLTAIHVIYPNS